MGGPIPRITEPKLLTRRPRTQALTRPLTHSPTHSFAIYHSQHLLGLLSLRVPFPVCQAVRRLRGPEMDSSLSWESRNRQDFAVWKC